MFSKLFHLETSRPQWRPDSDVLVCPCCEVGFSFFVRRHHCRNCGGVFCDGCSESRFPLGFLGYTEPERVCDSCIKQLMLDDAADNPANLHSEFGWGPLLMKYQDGEISDDDLCKNVCQNVPASMRKALWNTVIDKRLSFDPSQVDYQSLRSSPSPHEEKITLDVSRTFPDHPHFTNTKGQQTLFNVLKAYSTYNPTIGYTQGMSFIAGTALLVLGEEDTFLLMTVFMDNKRNVDGEVLRVTEKLKTTAPELVGHLEAQAVLVDVFVHRWLTTFFTYDLPITTTVHIWDLLVIFGPKFGQAFAVVLLQAASKSIRLLTTNDIIKFFNSLPAAIVTPILPLLQNAILLYYDLFKK